MIKLNLGGGNLPIEGFLNIDLCEGSDIEHDLRKPLRFKDNSIDEIIAIHVIESFYAWEFPDILKDWVRVLKPDSKITIEFTDLNKTINLYLNGETQQKKDWGHWGLYGNQTHPLDPIVLHHYVYTKKELGKLLHEAGLKDIEFTKENINHVKERDYRVIAYKNAEILPETN